MKYVILSLVMLLGVFRASAQDLIINGDMEIGGPSVMAVPTGWSLVTGTPDHCTSVPASSCMPPLQAIIPTNSPQGGKWTRFFHSSNNNERFGQYMCASLTAGESYTLSLWASYSRLNGASIATSTGIDIGFSMGLPIGTGAGANNATNISLTTPEQWVQHNFTFVASGNWDFISFAKNTVDVVNAVYIDNVALIGPYSTTFLGNDTTLCLGDTLTISPTIPGATYTWQDNSTAATFNVTGPGKYWVEVTNSCGTLADTLNVDYVNKPIFELGNDTILCQGEPLLLDATTIGATYLWSDNSANAAYSVNMPGTYWVEVAINGCTSADTIRVTYNPLAMVNLNDTSLCQGQILTLDASVVNASYLWQDGSAISTFNVIQAGVYWVEVTNNCGTTSDTINVSYSLSSMVNLGNDTLLCPGDVLTLDATNVNLNYLWQDNSTSPTFAVTQPGTYWVEVANSCGNIADTLLVTYNPVLSIQLGSDTSLCVGQTLTLNVTTFGATYLWQDNSTSPTLDVAQSGTYWVEVANSCGTVADTITITFGVLPVVELGNDTLFCSGDTLTLSVTDMNSLYLWQDNSTSPTFTVTQPGTYWVQLTNSCGTTGDTVEVIPGALPTVELGNDTLLCAGDSLTLNAANTNSAYLWQDNSTNPTLDVTQPGTYWVGVTNICGVKPDTISVMWQNCDCYLHVPNAFTPNGDNINDGFLPIPHCNFATYKLCIYNRWGDLIFQSSDYRISWNGMTNNGTKQSQQDVYVWVIDAVDEKGQAHQYLGHVTLVR